MASDRDVLNIAEIPHQDGSLRFRYSRYLSADGKKWVRHGLFHAFHANGQLASEGEYVDDLENGPWRDYHDNGRPAAEGRFKAGKKEGVWHYWDEEGHPEEDEEYVEGVIVQR
jgi:antitoxin component YwqK of YwqJK toxin-antitoxin module